MEQNYTQETIEKYLTGKLASSDMKSFEEGLTKDPLLKNEISLQKDIIEAIKDYRKTELKQRLNSVDIETPWYGTLVSKIAASIILTTLISSTTYFYLKSPKDIDSKDLSTNQNNKSINIQPEVNTIASNSKEEVKEVVKNEAAEDKNKTVNIEKKDIVAFKKKTNSEEKGERIKVKETVVFNPLDEDFNNLTDPDFQKDINFKVPEGNLAQETDNKISNLEVEINSHDEKKFHYQFYNNKLFLYCDFQSQPYELLELNTKKTKHLYLFYNNSYFELKPNQVEIAPLKEIKNNHLIKQLGTIKGNP